MSALLSVASVSVAFGGVQALDAVTLRVGAGEICALVGGNGAGKSTLLDAIDGARRPVAGHIAFEGRTISGLSHTEVARLGIARTHQQTALSDRASVADNLRVGVHRHLRAGLWAQLLGLPAARREEAEATRVAARWIADLGLAGLGERPAGQLSYGQRKRVELGRALAAAPRLLLLDEPAAGLLAEDARRIADLLRGISRAQGLAVLLVEHDLDLVEAIADRAVRLDAGRVVDDGPPGEVVPRLRAELGMAA